MSEMRQAGGEAADSSRLRQTRKHHSHSVAAHWRGNDAVFNRAVAHICRWERRDYPGLRATILALLDRPVTWQAVQHWLTGRRPVPVSAARALATVIKAESIYGLQLAAELEASADLREAASSTGKRVAQGFHRWK